MAWFLFHYQGGKVDAIALLKHFVLLKALLTRCIKKKPQQKKHQQKKTPQNNNKKKQPQNCQMVIQQVNEYS